MVNLSDIVPVWPLLVNIIMHIFCVPTFRFVLYVLYFSLHGRSSIIEIWKDVLKNYIKMYRHARSYYTSLKKTVN